MAKLYLDSNKVNVYPTALRGTGIDLSASLNTEFNITNVITRLCDKDCFVVSGPETVSGEKVFIVSLSGYWFRLVFPASALSNSIYVGIQLADHHFTTLDTLMLSNIAQGTETILDNSGTFEGLVYSSVESDLVDRDGNDLSIKLQIWDGTNQEVPEASWIRIGTHGIANTHYSNNLPSIEGELPINRNFITNGITVKNDNYTRFKVDANGSIVFQNISGSSRLEMSSDGNTLKKYAGTECIYKLDEDGNIGNYDFTVPTISGLTIKDARFEKRDSTHFEFDMPTADGKRVFYTSSDGTTWTKGLDYQKANFSYSNGVLTVEFND